MVVAPRFTMPHATPLACTPMSKAPPISQRDLRSDAVAQHFPALGVCRMHADLSLELFTYNLVKPLRRHGPAIVHPL